MLPQSGYWTEKRFRFVNAFLYCCIALLKCQLMCPFFLPPQAHTFLYGILSGKRKTTGLRIKNVSQIKQKSKLKNPTTVKIPNTTRLGFWLLVCTQRLFYSNSWTQHLFCFFLNEVPPRSVLKQLSVRLSWKSVGISEFRYIYLANGTGNTQGKTIVFF